MKKQAVLSLSGGMDSSTVLLHLLAHGYEVTALSFDYGQKHNVELERAAELIEYLDRNGHSVKYQRITLQGLVGLLDSNLVKGGEEVPEGHYEEDNMKDTVVPNRNKIFSSIIQAVALSIAQQNDCEVKIAMGIHAGDHAIYPDCRQEFRDADYEAFKQGNWDADKVKYITPYLEDDKYGILVDGEAACAVLGLDFDEVYKRTNTSYKPDAEGRSDYKSASSVERIEAFLKLNRKDPVEYIDGWETAKDHVEKLLESHA
jgi:7-cyano-7-deazaguanine synthase|tara:strand:+ start:15235 stop:16011 length:777 start_codon:yes stop_codon:yes gene_type:complete